MRRHPMLRHTSPFAGHASARHQRGVFGLMAAFTLLTALAFAALSLDAGRLWLERRSVQRAADMAAVAASRFIGCGTNVNDALKAATEVAGANGIDVGTVKVAYGNLKTDAKGTFVFTKGATSENADAVQVELSKSVTKSLVLGGAAVEKVLIPAVSAAKGHAPVASFAINSVYGINQSLAKATSGLFGAILGTSNLTLSQADLAKLLNEKVTLADLMKVAPQYTSVGAMLNQTVTLQSMLQRIAGANSNIASNGAFVKILKASENRPLVFIRLGEVISIHMVTNAKGEDETTAGVKEARINALDLILTGVQVFGTKIGGGLFNFGIDGIFVFKIKMFNAPKLALGPAGYARDGMACTSAQSSQFSVQVGIDLSWLLGLADMVLRMDTGAVEGRLTGVTIKNEGITADVAAQNITVALVLTNHKDVNKPLIPTDKDNKDTFGPATVLGGLFGVKIYLPILTAKPVTKSINLTSKYDLPQPVTLAAGTVGQTLAGYLGTSTNIKFVFLGGLFAIPLPAGFIADVITWIMTPLGEMLDGLLALAGIQTGNAYLQMRTIEMLPPTLVN
jgi:uncharacterized membrane protein